MTLEILLKCTLLVAVILSFFVFVKVMIMNDKTHRNIFSTWQFPMLLAIFLDTFYIL